MKNPFKKGIALCCCILTVLFLSGCSSAPTGGEDSAPVLIVPEKEKYQTATVTRGSIERAIEVRGSLVPESVADACFKYRSGYLASINVKLGDTVKKGDVLATLDDTDIRYNVKQQEIKLQLAQLTYDEAVKANKSEFDVKKASLMLQSEKVMMEQLQNTLKSYTLTAEIPGRVVAIADVRPSQYITGNLAIVTIADPSRYTVLCKSDSKEFSIGLKIAMTKQGTSKVYNGEIVSNTNITSKTTEGVIAARFMEPPNDLGLSDNMLLSVKLPQKDNILVIPQKALAYGEGDHPYVRIMKGEQILERYIDTGIFNKDLIEVVNGLSEGEVIITN